MDSIPPLPSSRPRSKLRPHDARSTGRRPVEPSSSHSTQASSERRQSARLKSQSASSPEVISSLISSLSAISIPAADLFDGPVPGFNQSPAPSPTRSAFPNTGVGGKKTLQSYLNPGDAAIPPVVRTSKPPSGLSPITAPKKKKSSSPLPSPSWPLPELDYDYSKIGKVTIEPGPVPSSASAKSAGSGKAKSNKSLTLKASKEKMREMDRERKRKSAKASSDDNLRSRKGKDVARPDNLSVNRPPVQGENQSPPRIPQRAASMQVVPVEEIGIASTSDDLTLGTSRAIPVRDSSLRHSTGSTPPRRRRKSYRTSRAPTEPPLERHTEESEMEQSKSESGTKPVNAEDNVSKRIRELKAQKELRDRSQSDDETTKEREKELWKTTTPARSSLPAPSSTRMTVPRTTSKIENRRSDDPTLQRHDSKRDSVSKASFKSAPASPNLNSHERSISTTLNQATRHASMDGRPSTADSIADAVEDYICNPRLSQKVTHPQTGRVVCFSEVGDPDGSVVFCCVGMGTTRFLTAFYDELAITLKLRLITPDRPGIGDSQAYSDGSDTPLGWPDDIRIICQHLGISRFSILAHSAGAIYALATALRMPQHIRGRIHLLAPWIAPSQMVSIGITQDKIPVTSLPYSQRFLRSLPTPFLKAANSNFFSMTSTSITTSIQKAPRRTKRRSLTAEGLVDQSNQQNGKRPSIPNNNNRRGASSSPPPPGAASFEMARDDMISPPRLKEKERQSEYDAHLTQAIWTAATTNANPAVDLLVCLERRQEIGFRYVDITKAVVIHHGTRDSRVPLENVKWLSRTMRRCEVRVLEGEGHGLMASANVMSSVLTEMGKEWEDWDAVTKGRREKAS